MSDDTQITKIKARFMDKFLVGTGAIALGLLIWIYSTVSDNNTKTAVLIENQNNIMELVERYIPTVIENKANITILKEKL
jgi:hypothetical protein